MVPITYQLASIEKKLSSNDNWINCIKLAYTNFTIYRVDQCFFDLLAAPSTIFIGTETTARHVNEINQTFFRRVGVVRFWRLDGRGLGTCEVSYNLFI